MTNQEYVTNLIQQNDRIIIDTSALMDVEELELLTNNYHQIFSEESKQITIPCAVYKELMRHSQGFDERKQGLALKALNIIDSWPQIFRAEVSDDNTEDLSKAFADNELLSDLIAYKTKGSQLFVGNDRGLTADAYNLNHLASCGGYPIKVCFLNKYGELHCCACARERPESVITERRETIHTIEEKKYSEPIAPAPTEEKKAGSWIPRVVVPIGTLLFGLAAGKYGGDVLKLLPKLHR